MPTSPPRGDGSGPWLRCIAPRRCGERCLTCDHRACNVAAAFYDTTWARCLAPATALSVVTPGMVGVVRVNMIGALVSNPDAIAGIMAMHAGAGAAAEMLCSGVAGRLSDTYGRKIFLVGSMAVFATMQTTVAGI